MSLRTNYKDDILDTDINVNRKFNIISSGGTVIQSDVEIRETTAFTQQGDSFGAADINATNEAINALFDVIRPIGSLYSTVDSTFNPNNASGWHGTWERITDCVIYAASDNVTGGIGSIVGSNTHTITVDEMPNHDHTIPALSGTATGGNHRHEYYMSNGNVSGGSAMTSYISNNPTTKYTSYSGNLSLGVTTNASTTGSKGSGTAMDLRSRRINAIVWKRTA